MGLNNSKTPRQSTEEYIYSILNNNNIPIDNIQTVTTSVLFRYIGANTLNDVLN